MLDRIDLREDHIALTIDRSGLSEYDNCEPLVLSLATAKVRRGHQLRLVIPGPTALKADQANRDDKLVELVAEAQRAKALVLAAPDKSIAAIAFEHGRCRTRLGKLAGLACLAPNIVTTIVEGRQPQTMTAATLLAVELPLCWSSRRAMLGFS